MPNVTTGLFDKDSLIYYVDTDLVVLDDPYTLKRMVVLKASDVTNEFWFKVNAILYKIKYKLKNDPIRRPDGLWTCEVEALNG